MCHARPWVLFCQEHPACLETLVFLRSPMPFGGAMASRRVTPVIGFEAVESQKMPGVALDRMCHRPTFNRAPRGWASDYCPESNELWKGPSEALMFFSRSWCTCTVNHRLLQRKEGNTEHVRYVTTVSSDQLRKPPNAAISWLPQWGPEPISLTFTFFSYK